MDQETSGSTPLFAVFVLSLISIVLIPYTLYSLFGGEEDEKKAVKTWDNKKNKPKQSFIQSMSGKIKQTFTTKLIVAWILYFLLLLYVQYSAAPLQRFDPFEILQVPESASDAEIKRAYRKLALQYHPDKNPDPAAAEYFAQYITKAYKALTDEVARENYIKFGHPDGSKAVSYSVALPEWLFSKDKQAAPAILLTLLLGGIVLPLGFVACYMGRSNKVTGHDEVSMETTQFYFHSPFNVKQYQNASRLPETLVYAMEFAPPQFRELRPEEMPSLEALRRELGSHFPEVRDKKGPFFTKRPGTIAKAHLLLLAHMARIPIDPILKKDYDYVMKRVPRLIQELFGVASVPRIAPAYGWLAPSLGAVELMQCIFKAVPIEEKKKGGKAGEAIAAMMQFPSIDEELVKKLAKNKIKTLADLKSMDPMERRVTLQSCGMALHETDEMEVGLSAIPRATITAQLFAEDPESGTLVDDFEALGEVTVLTCEVHAIVERDAHRAPGFDPTSVEANAKSGSDKKTSMADKAPQAYTPNFPVPRQEHWFFLLADNSSNSLLAWSRVSLLEAEIAGISCCKNAAPPSADEVKKLGQKIELKFIAPSAGKHDLTLYAMPDCWLGIDKTVSLKLKTTKATRAEMEGRVVPAMVVPDKKKKGGSAKNARDNKNANSNGTRAAALDRSEESEALLRDEDDEDGEIVSYANDDDEEDEDDDEEDSGDDEYSDEDDSDEDDSDDREYDSDEYGTEETASDVEDKDDDLPELVPVGAS